MRKFHTLPIFNKKDKKRKSVSDLEQPLESTMSTTEKPTDVKRDSGITTCSAEVEIVASSSCSTSSDTFATSAPTSTPTSTSESSCSSSSSSSSYSIAELPPSQKLLAMVDEFRQIATCSTSSSSSSCSTSTSTSALGNPRVSFTSSSSSCTPPSTLERRSSSALPTSSSTTLVFYPYSNVSPVPSNVHTLCSKSELPSSSLSSLSCNNESQVCQYQQQQQEQRQSMTSKRLFIVYELYTTELIYLKGLHHVASFYMDPLLSHPHSPLDKSKARQLFGNLKELIALNSEFLNRLAFRLFGDNPHPTSLEPLLKTDLIWQESQSIADCLLDFIPFFKAYAVYARHFEVAIHILVELQSNTEFIQFLKQLGPDASFYTLQSHLILPIQRIPRYKLLLHDLLKSSEPSSETPYLELALMEIEKLAQFVNESIRNHEKAMEMVDLKKKLIGYQGEFFLPSRYLMRSGPLIKVSRKSKDERFVILFNDFLMLTSKISSNKLLFHRGFDLSEIHAVHTRHDLTNAIEIQAEQKSFILIAETFELFQDWKASIQKAIIEHVSRPNPTNDPPPTLKEPRPQSLPISIPYVRGHVAPIWAPNDSVQCCSNCQKNFTVLRRKHHCRICGQIVCAKCSGGGYSVIIEKQETFGKQRVCTSCYQSKLTDKFLAETTENWLEGLFDEDY